MRLIINSISLLALCSCTTHQEVSSSLEESTKILNERAAGAKKVTDARANVNVHGIMEIRIPKPKNKMAEVKKILDLKKEVDIFETRPNGMVREGEDE